MTTLKMWHIAVGIAIAMSNAIVASAHSFPSRRLRQQDKKSRLLPPR